RRTPGYRLRLLFRARVEAATRADPSIPVAASIEERSNILAIRVSRCGLALLGKTRVPSLFGVPENTLRKTAMFGINARDLSVCVERAGENRLASPKETTCLPLFCPQLKKRYGLFL